MTGKIGDSRLRIGVDVGGTFTDLVIVLEDGRTHVFKVPTVPKDPSLGVLNGIGVAAAELDVEISALLGRCDAFVHGSTIATNTVLERKGARVGLLTTAGFRDSLAIRRGLRENPWDHRTPFAPPLVPRHLRLGIRGRLDECGRELEPLDEGDINKALETFAAYDVEAIAICFIHSYVDACHERAAESAIRNSGCGLPISLSSSLAPILGEYERSSTTVIDAHVRARVVTYLEALEQKLRDSGLSHGILIVQSNGGAVSVGRVAHAPVGICLSGPAAGVGAMRYFGGMCGTNNLITMEIGGTSCDVTLMREGRAQLVDLYTIGGFHVAQPAVEIHTVGAGGGTIARVDEAGLLICGPQGAGADPGPAAYCRGGDDATTTDALVLLGRMRSGPIADGTIEISADKARAAIQAKVSEPLRVSEEDAAAGIVSLLEQNLLHAVEEISVKRGIDPSGFTLVAAGGAGPMHGAAVGRMLGCSRVYVPRHAGVFCALGMLDSDLRLDFLRVLDIPLDQTGVASLGGISDAMKNEASRDISRDGGNVGSLAFETELDLAYSGQLRSLRIPWSRERDSVADVRANFEREHRQTYGHIKPITPIRIVGLRLVAAIPAQRLAPLSFPAAETPLAPSGKRRVFVDLELGWVEAPVYSGSDMLPGHRAEGPLIVEEATTTIFAGQGDVLSVDDFGNYLIEIG